MNSFQVSVQSEIGQLEGVILHRPGKEVENMTPEHVARALYSDILNLAVVLPEYSQLQGVLEKVTQTFFVHDLLAEALAEEQVKQELLQKICQNEGICEMMDELGELPAEQLATSLIEGVMMKKDTLSRFLSKEYYVLQPLHNFFFTRDAAISMNQWVLIGKMAGKVRERETMIMETIFESHPLFHTKTVNPMRERPFRSEGIIIEGGGCAGGAGRCVADWHGRSHYGGGY